MLNVGFIDSPDAAGLSAFYDTAIKKLSQTVDLSGLFHFSQQSSMSLRFMK
ncbi:hypothetical protein [Escherichia coli]|uniref:hypothetical protein n=1 Tax=Escherichia coli TaxID=562 RepID=UPI001BD69916|nr:hypothetical protein [Escherichia coli]